MRISVGPNVHRKPLSPASVAGIVFAVGLILRLLYLASVPPGVFGGDAQAYDEQAWRLAGGQGYVTAEGRPTAWRPPGYPVFLAAIYRATGHDRQAVRLVQAVLGAGICSLVYLIMRRSLPERRAAIAALICCGYLPLVVSTSELMTEVLFTFLLLLGLYLVLRRQDWWALAATGLVFGWALLTRPVLLFFLPLLALWVWLRDGPRAVRGLAWIGMGLLLVVLPWTLRNYDRLHGFVPLSTIGGLALYNSYVVAERGLGYNSLTSVGPDYAGMDEVEQSRFLTRKTLEHVRAHPEEILPLTGLKLLLLVYPFDGRWYPLSFGSKYNVWWGLAFSFALPALWRLRPVKGDDATLVAFLFISFLLGVMVFYGSPRFRLPLEPLLIAFAVQGALHLYHRRRAAVWGVVGLNIGLFLLFGAFEPRALFEWLKSWM